MNIFLVFILSYVAGIGFCLLFQVKKRNIPLASLCSAASWTVFQILLSLGINSVFATLVSGIILGFMTEVFAIILKSPAINFILIGIIPLVPGLKVYQGMLKLIEGNMMPGISLILEATFIGIAIGISILLSTSVARAYRIAKSKNKK